MVSLDISLGSAFIGLIVGAVLYGITVLQCYRYFHKYHEKDSRFLKCFIMVMMAIDTLNFAFISHFYYYYTVSHFGDFAVLSVAVWTVPGEIVVGAVLSSMVQMFYASRVYHLSKNLFIPILICILSVVQTSLGIVTTIKITTVKYFAFAKLSEPWGVAAMSCELACDILITGAMVYYLQRNKTGFKKTNRAVGILIQYMVNTGALTTLFALGTVLGWTITPTSLVDICFYIIMVRLYPCSFLSVLNSRNRVREVLHATALNSINISRLTTTHHDSEETASQSTTIPGGGKTKYDSFQTVTQNSIMTTKPTGSFA